MNPDEQNFFKPYFNKEFLRKSNVEYNSIERNSGRLPSNLEFLKYEK